MLPQLLWRIYHHSLKLKRDCCVQKSCLVLINIKLIKNRNILALTFFSSFISDIAISDPGHNHFEPATLVAIDFHKLPRNTIVELKG